MATDPGSMRRSWVGHSPADLFLCVPAPPQRAAPRGLTVLSFAALRGFADGFGGGLIGGIFCWLGLAYFHPAGLELVWLRVLVLSLIFGVFEMWRVIRNRTLRGAKTCLIWTLVASFFVLLALGAVISPTDSSGLAPPPHFNHSRVARLI